MKSWLVAAVAAGLLTFAVVLPTFMRIDLVPARVLAHPAFADNALFLSYAAPVVDAVLVFIWTTLALAVLIGRWTKRTSTGREPGTGRYRFVARAAIYVLALVSLVPLVLGAMSLPTDVRTGFGASYRHTCGGCHPSGRALAFLRSPEAWRLTLERHRHYAPEHFDDEAVESALEYLIAKRSLSGAGLFRVKCLSCHREGAIGGPRTAPDWRRVVDRIARYHPFYISPMEKDELVAYLTSGPLLATDRRDATELGRREVFEVGCARCHTLGVVLDAAVSDDEWPDLLARMANKAPALMTEDDAVDLAPWIIEWRREPDAFARAFPHHGTELFFSEVYN